MNKSITRQSKFLSLILRHEPERIGLTMSADGWVNVQELIKKLDDAGKAITLDQLRIVVATNDKKRFAFNEDKTRIRASQGHSVPVNLDLPSEPPPAQLFHGTATRFVDTIHREGLSKMNRQHVHLTASHETAQKVGQRHGKPVILKIAASKMHGDGHEFYQSENGVWLTSEVPPQFINFPAEAS